MFDGWTIAEIARWCFTLGIIVGLASGFLLAQAYREWQD